MLLPKRRASADCRIQAAHLREFLHTVRDDDRLRAVLLDAAARLDQLAEELDRLSLNKGGQADIRDEDGAA
jgi:hypothetical protein